MLATMAMCGLSVNAADMVIGQRFTSIEDLDGKLFAVVDESASTAMGFGIPNHGNSWDMYFGTYNEAYASNACYLKIEAASEGYCYLHTYNSAGNLYDISWAAGGYFNSQKANQTCCFALGKDQDGADLSVWTIEESEGKFALKNKGTGLYLHADNLPAKYEDAFYFTFCTLIEDPLPAAQEKYNTLKDKYLAINADLDVTEAETLFASATTVDEVQTAIDKLVSTFGTYVAGVAGETNLTSLITNPSFESGFSGWANNGMATQNNSSFPGKEGTYYCEAWQPNGTKGVSQTLILPQGLYRMSANSLARGVTSAKIYAGSKEKAITIVDASNTYIFEFYVSSNGDVAIGFEGVGTGAGASWLCVDNFEMAYVQNMTAEEYTEYETRKEALAAYNEALAAAKAIEEGTIPSTAYTYLQTAIAQYTITDGTSNEYNAAAAALKQAATVAQSLVAPYAAWKELKAYADALVAVSTNYTEKNETLASAISTQNTAAEGATSANAITTATATLKTAMVTYATTAEPTNDECFDLTFMIVNQHFTEGAGGTAVPTGWTLESGAITEHRLLTHNFEAYRTPFNLSQTIEGLQKGTYKVTLQGFARHDDTNVTDKTNLYCGIVNQEIKDIKAEWSTTSFYSSEQTSMGDENRDTKYQKNGVDVYQPNGMTGAYYWFQETNPETNQPFYTNEVQTLIPTDGDLKIGFKCETNTDWVIWDNFHLYYYGSAIAVTIDENQPISFSEEVENANITLNRTFIADKWNTIALPFDLSDTETKAAFGDGAQVATYSETLFENDVNSSTVTFDIASDAAITANTPVLLKTSTDETTFTFNGKTIKAGEAKAEGTNFDFVGTYAATTTIVKGDYFIGNNQLWRSEGTTTIKGTRAYLKAKTDNSEARIAGFVINDEVTAIEGLTVENANNAALYNLNGQRISTPKKGLYIREGKKFVVK